MFCIGTFLSVKAGPMAPSVAFSAAKTVFDRVAAGIGLVMLLPALLVGALIIVIEDRWPVLYWHTRIGRGGKCFWLLKFRSMRAGCPGSQVTAGNDPRLTRVGRALRKYKIDELPQLWNVLKGDMSLVGPRPEAPVYVDLSDPQWQCVCQVRPGITDLASLIYRNEEDVLARADDPERYYRERVLPDKLRLNILYLKRRSFWLDIKLILLTVWHSFIPSRFDADRVKLAFGVPLDPGGKAMDTPAASPKEAVL